MCEDIADLEANNTWTLTDLRPSKLPLAVVGSTKLNRVNGTVEQCKTRLVAKGYAKLEGLDYLDTFVPVAKLTTIRPLLTLAVINRCTLKQLDANNAFLHGDLNEEVYMKIPPGLSHSHMNQVCKLQRSLYGLKQARRQCYAKLSRFLYQNGYKHFTTDHSLFLKHTHNYTTALLVYVDDIVLIGNNPEKLSHVTLIKTSTSKTWEILRTF